MNARAAASTARGAASGSQNLLRLFAAALLGTLAVPADAQVVGSVGVDSDYRLRGYSLTDDHPALSGQVTYDDPSGAYISLAALTELSSDRRFLGATAIAGYAKRLGRDVTIDAGVLRSQIRAPIPHASGFKYSEVYAGVYVGPVAGRIYYSPDYRTGNQSTLYGELEASFEPLRNWHLAGHVGRLIYLSSSPFYRGGDTNQDWRLTAARQLGRFELHIALSSGGSHGYYGYGVHRKAALTAGGSVSF